MLNTIWKPQLAERLKKPEIVLAIIENSVSACHSELADYSKKTSIQHKGKHDRLFKWKYLIYEALWGLKSYYKMKD